MRVVSSTFAALCLLFCICFADLSIGQQGEEDGNKYKLGRANVLQNSLEQEEIQQEEQETEITLEDELPEEPSKRSNSNLSPLVIIPGLMDTRLEAKLNKSTTKKLHCYKKSDWYDIWLEVMQLSPLQIDCLADNISLRYNKSTRTTSNAHGVEIRVKKLKSNLSVLNYQSSLRIPYLAYATEFITKLTQKNGYIRDLNLIGAPYDWRKAANEMDDYFIDLKFNIEKMYANNNRRAVTIVCHSMGCSLTLYFLHRRSQRWKDKFIRRLISLAPAWGGSVYTVYSTIYGYDGVPMVDALKMRDALITFPSVYFNFPNSKIFGDEPIIRFNVDQGGKENRSMGVYMSNFPKEFFDELGNPEGYEMSLDTKDLLGQLQPPKVEVWCVVGVGRDTLERMDYSGSFPDSSYKLINGDGDGMVLAKSAKLCIRWKRVQDQPVHLVESQALHHDFIKDPQIMEFISSRIL